MKLQLAYSPTKSMELQYRERLSRGPFAGKEEDEPARHLRRRDVRLRCATSSNPLLGVEVELQLPRLSGSATSFARRILPTTAPTGCRGSMGSPHSRRPAGRGGLEVRMD
ncbi:unnamed protein product [Urochloa humidicola]